MGKGCDSRQRTRTCDVEPVKRLTGGRHVFSLLQEHTKKTALELTEHIYSRRSISKAIPQVRKDGKEYTMISSRESERALLGRFQRVLNVCQACKYRTRFEVAFFLPV